jgi:GT2 family glycosyltransferase
MNLALAQASHDLVLVTHDDCTVARNWVDEAVRLASQVPGGIVTGRVLPPDGSVYVPSTKLSTEPEDYTGRTAWEVEALFPNNMALSRSAAADIGGFDERDGLRVAEDVDFQYRWLRAGRSLRYEPEMIVWHHDWRPIEEVIHTHQAYARGRGVFFAKQLRAGQWRDIVPWLWADLYQWARSIASGLLGRRLRWRDHRREVIPYVILGLAQGWAEAGRLERAGTTAPSG